MCHTLCERYEWGSADRNGACYSHEAYGRRKDLHHTRLTKHLEYATCERDMCPTGRSRVVTHDHPLIHPPSTHA